MEDKVEVVFDTPDPKPLGIVVIGLNGSNYRIYLNLTVQSVKEYINEVASDGLPVFDVTFAIDLDVKNIDNEQIT